MLDRLKVVGSYKGWSGYDTHTREFVRGFVCLGIKVQLIHVPGWSAELPPERREAELFDSLGTPVDATTVLHFTVPTDARPIPALRNFNYTMFEANGIPEEWVLHAIPHHLVVVPTESSRQAWVNSGVPERKLCISPLGVDGHFFSQSSTPLALTDARGRPVASYRARFLHLAEIRPRKNHLGLLRAWMKATTPRDDAILIMKLSAFRPRARAQFDSDVADMLALAKLSPDKAAPVIFLTDLLTREELRALYRTATHYISFSHGEGWDMCMMEAAAAGLGLIAPAHTAYLHYLGAHEAAFIPAALAPATFGGRMGHEDATLFDGLSWWYPNEDAAVEIIRRIVREGWKADASPQQRIVTEYTWENAARALQAIVSP